MEQKKRCSWCLGQDIYIDYHDQEWGVPVHDDQLLFEMLLLEGAQAGLSWITVLKKRENYRKAFDQFDPVAIAGYGDEKKAELLQNSGIIRNRLKINAAVVNARAYLNIMEQPGGFDQFLWQFVDGRPIQNAWKNLEEVPASTTESDRMSKALKKQGFKFVGSTICYAFMQACGMVNDHTTDCWRWQLLS
ncbi:MAG: DNA-3-methyladenine glycosylase I [Bacteroidota bacterium]